MEKSIGSKSKMPAVATYVIAVVFLIAGLAVPITASGFGGVSDILALQLPDAVNSIVNLNISVGYSFSYLYYFNLFGLIDGINLYAVLALLYALITLVALIGIIPVAAGKKDKGTYLKVASVMEVLALLTLGLFIICELVYAYAGGLDYWKWNMVGAFGGTLLMLIIQAFYYKGSSGVVKFVLFLLSAIALLSLFGLTVNASLADFATNLGANIGFTSMLTDGTDAVELLLILMYAPGTLIDGMAAAEITLTLAALIAAVMVIANVLLDMMGLAKKTNKFMLVSNIIRYGIEVAALIVTAVMIYVNKYAFGIMIIPVSAAALIALIINIVRLVKFKKVKASDDALYKVVAPEDEDVAVAAPIYANETVSAPAPAPAYNAPAPVYSAPVIAIQSAPAPAPAPREEEKNAPAVSEVTDDMYISNEPVQTTIPLPDSEADKVETHNFVYNMNAIYNGPTDSFISKLSSSEKVEFAKVFIERNSGNLGNIPEYVIGGDNKKFFSAVFIYFGKVRSLVSDGLMNKFYEQVNLMH